MGSHISGKWTSGTITSTWAPTFKHLRQFKSYMQIKTANLFCKTWGGKKGGGGLAQNNMSQPVRETYSQRSWFSGMWCQVCGSQRLGGTCCLCKCLYPLCPPKRFHCNVGTYLQTTWCYFPENCDLDSLQSELPVSPVLNDWYTYYIYISISPTFLLGPLSACKNNHRSSHLCSCKYNVSR